jgi:phosphoribosylanthranilate isomerase
LTRIKICGITSQGDLKAAVAAGADALGFIVEIERSRRCLSADVARDLIKKVPIFITTVAVMEPSTPEEAARLAGITGADLLQLYGLEASLIAALKGLVQNAKIIAAAPAGPEARHLAEVADAVLLDTMKGGRLGGSGEAHDWAQSAVLAKDLPVPTILAGGLDPSNVRAAISQVRPYAVDVSSGVETDGQKDGEKMRSFVKAARGC